MESTQRLLVAGAAVVLAILGGAVALRSVVADEGTTRTEVASAEESISAPSAGTRWVGWGRVVVAVPDWWTTGETQCLAPVEDTVYFDMAATADCADPPEPATVREVSALAVLDGTSGYGEYKIREMRPVATVDGHEVVELESCEEWFDGACRNLFAVPSEGVVFAVTIAEEGDGSYDEIFNSVQILPPAQTVVPLASADGWTPAWGAEPRAAHALSAAIENAGLRVEFKESDPSEGRAMGLRADLPAGSLLDVEPQLGSVIDKGGTVTLTVLGDANDG